VLVGLDADARRLEALAADCRRRAGQARTLRGAWQLVQTRRSGPRPEPWPRALEPLRWASRREIASVWALGAELADMAAQRVRGCSTLNWPHCSSLFWPHLWLGVVRA